MAMFSQLRNCNIMHYITEMHVMPITFQLLLHYNKLKLVGDFKNLIAGILNNISNNYIFQEYLALMYSVTYTCCKISLHLI